MISGSLSLLCSRCFSPFPHGTGPLSVSWSYLALRDGPRWFTLNFSCSALLRCRLDLLSHFVYGAFTLCGDTFQYLPLCYKFSFLAVLQPRSLPRQRRFGLVCVRSPLLTQSLLFSFPPATEMFQFTGLAPCSAGCRDRSRRVAPFGHPRIFRYLPFPAAFRSLSRPSSPPRA